MKNSKNLLYYLLMIGLFISVSYWVLKKGSLLQASHLNLSAGGLKKINWNEFGSILLDSMQTPLPVLLLQIVLILVVARFLGLICSKLGQPRVIGEIIAGILLGPSLFGKFFPESFLFIFPKVSLGNLQFLSQIGLMLFMYVVGMELDLQSLKNKARDAVMISHASIIIPFGLGLILAYSMYTNYSPVNIDFISFSLFIGIAMSITAFPVLARIVQERELTKTRIGTIVITCAAADDITAWCILAGVIAIVKAGSMLNLIYILLFAIFYVLIMLKVIRPFLHHMVQKQPKDSPLGKSTVALFFIILILSSYITEVIGIHALFGAFMAGIIMPSNINVRRMLVDKIEDVALVLLLPLFFVFTGLRTEISLLNDTELWKQTAIIILVASSGKFLGSAITAKFIGQSWKDSLTIGALMNTRGLVELVVLNIGYDLGVLSPSVFTMMVVMALFTTLMTGPLLDLINYLFATKSYGKLADKVNV